MPRPRKQAPSNPQLSSGQASYIVEKLISERRLSVGELNRYIGDMQREIADLERRLQSLRAATGASSSGAAAAPRRRGRPPRNASAGAAAPSSGAGTGATPAAASPASSRAATGRRRRRSRKITPEQAASRVLQGRYLGLIRQIPATRRAQYQRTARERGREAAIKDMLTALKK